MPDGIVYFIEAEGVGLIKIGFTAGPPGSRFQRLRLVSPAPLAVLGTIAGTKARERRLHARFRPLWSHGEWFRGAADLRRYIAEHAAEWRDEPRPVRPIIGRDYDKPKRSTAIPLADWAKSTPITSRGKTFAAVQWSRRKGVPLARMRDWLARGVHPDNLFMVDLPPNPGTPYSIPVQLEGLIRV